MDTESADGSPARIYLTAEKLGSPSAPYRDGTTPASAVAFKITVEDITGNAYLNGSGFALEPSNGGSGSSPAYGNNNDRNQSIERMLCKHTRLFNNAFDPNAANSDGWDLSAGSRYAGCIVFDYIGKALPTTLTYSDDQSNVQKQQIWNGRVGPGPASRIRRTTLANWSGYGSRLISVPSVVMHATDVALCWNMTGPGNHIIQAEGQTNGEGITLFANTLGGEDKQCRSVNPQSYLQVLAEDYWTIEFIGYR